jgi:hypothetical protein
MSGHLGGARAKVQRAKENLNDLVVKAREFASFNPYGVVIEDNPNSGERIWRARVSRPIPDTWPIIVGDVVHGLRAALDYLAWELWITNGGDIKDPAATGIVFPVTDPTKTFTPEQQETARQRKETTFGVDATAIIDRLQVDIGRKASTDPELKPLFLLHRLDIWDKHRRLHIVGGTVRLMHMEVREDIHIQHMVIGGGGPTGSIRTVPITDGTELLRLTLGPTTPNVQMNERFTAYIAFEQEGPGKGESVLETLDQLVSFVDEALTIFAQLLP